MTAPNAPMSAEEARAVLDTADALLHSLKMDPDTKAIHIERFSRARTAVAAMAEREAETSRALTASLNVVKRLQAERDALVREVEALRADAERWRLLKAKATKKTAHDIYGNGAFWSIGIHSEDQRLDFEAAIDAADAAAAADAPRIERDAQATDLRELLGAA